MPSGHANSLHRTPGRESASSWGQQSSGERLGEAQLRPAEAAMEFFREYARERPEVVALWAFGVGFVLAWKLKPW